MTNFDNRSSSSWSNFFSSLKTAPWQNHVPHYKCNLSTTTDERNWWIRVTEVHFWKCWHNSVHVHVWMLWLATIFWSCSLFCCALSLWTWEQLSLLSTYSFSFRLNESITHHSIPNLFPSSSIIKQNTFNLKTSR